MRVYVVYDKRTGKVVHKHRRASIDDPNGEDTADCAAADVLATYRGDTSREHLSVALVDNYRPRSSRGRTSRFDAVSGSMIDDVALPVAPRRGARRAAVATAESE